MSDNPTRSPMARLRKSRLLKLALPVVALVALIWWLLPGCVVPRMPWKDFGLLPVNLQRSWVALPRKQVKTPARC